MQSSTLANHSLRKFDDTDCTLLPTQCTDYEGGLKFNPPGPAQIQGQPLRPRLSNKGNALFHSGNNVMSNVKTLFAWRNPYAVFSYQRDNSLKRMVAIATFSFGARYRQVK